MFQVDPCGCPAPGATEDTFLQSGSLKGTKLSLVMNDKREIEIDLADLIPPAAADKHVESATLQDTTLTLTLNDQSQVTVDLAELVFKPQTSHGVKGAGTVDDPITVRVHPDSATVLFNEPEGLKVVLPPPVEPSGPCTRPLVTDEYADYTVTFRPLTMADSGSVVVVRGHATPSAYASDTIPLQGDFLPGAYIDVIVDATAGPHANYNVQLPDGGNITFEPLQSAASLIHIGNGQWIVSGGKGV